MSVTITVVPGVISSGIGAPMCAQLANDFGIFARRILNGTPALKRMSSPIWMLSVGLPLDVFSKTAR